MTRCASCELFAFSTATGGRYIHADQYSDIWGINRLHYYKGARPQVCDHFHDGRGFLTSHAALPNTFEARLYQVKPKLTLPRWDFTIESFPSSPTFNVDGGETTSSATKTPLLQLQPSWLGTSDPVDNMVKYRSITQPRVILITLSPPLNGGIFGASEPYTSVR